MYTPKYKETHSHCQTYIKKTHINFHFSKQKQTNQKKKKKQDKTKQKSKKHQQTNFQNGIENLTIF